MAKNALLLGRNDNVATALEPLAKGVLVEAVYASEAPVTTPAQEEIPFGFKVAVRSIARGETILKYGEVIGQASEDIAPGQLVHVHNVEGTRGRGDKHD